MTISFNAIKRDTVGKGSARSLRRQGMIPAIIYGKDKKEVLLALPQKELTVEHNKGTFMSQLIDLNVDGTSYKVVPRSVQLHPVTDVIEHADFSFVSPKEKVKVKVKINFINMDKCIGIKRGGLLNIEMREVELLCNSSNIPSKIDLDLLNMNIGASIHLSDLQLPEGSSFALNRPELTVATLLGRGGKKGEEEGEGTAPAA
jgi:large subunit ribosomal protein L25